ncbi:hypothetical protein EJP617_D070 (plasmid) [Erwinia sp. Ejp617]|nr:hypothetical protein EJP617_D070 [Erwinia sp. Ejp617]
MPAADPAPGRCRPAPVRSAPTPPCAAPPGPVRSGPPRQRRCAARRGAPPPGQAPPHSAAGHCDRQSAAGRSAGKGRLCRSSGDGTGYLPVAAKGRRCPGWRPRRRAGAPSGDRFPPG